MQTRRRTTRPQRTTFMPPKLRMTTPTSLPSPPSHATGMPPPSHPQAPPSERGAVDTSAMAPAGSNGMAARNGMMALAGAAAAATPNAINAASSGNEYALQHNANNGSANSNNGGGGGYHRVNGGVPAPPMQPPMMSNSTSANNSITDSTNGGAVAAAVADLGSSVNSSKTSSSGGSESCLQRLVREAGIEQHGLPLKDLRRHIGTAEVVLGIDGAHLLQRMTTAVRTRDPMAVFTATMPIVLYEELAAIRSEVNAIGEALAAMTQPNGTPAQLGFKPVFVFDGIDLSPAVDPPFTPPPPTPEEWFHYHAHDSNGAVACLPAELKRRAASRFRCEDDVRSAIVRQLKMLYRNVFRAPYTAAAQLSAFLLPQNRYVSEVYGSLALLAYPGVERVVTNINPDTLTFDVVYKSAVLECMNRRVAWQRRFTEADLAEWIVLDMMQDYLHISLPPKKVADVLESLLRADVMPVHSLTTAFAANFQKDLSRTLHASLALLDAPVLLSSGACVPLHVVHHTAPHLPVSLREAFGVQLPSVLYFSLFAGLVSPTLMSISSQRCVVDRWPLVDSAAYREVQHTILTLRVQACCQLIKFTNTLPPPHMWYRQYAQMRRNNVMKDDKVRPVQRPTDVLLVEWDVAGDVALNQCSMVHFVNVLDYMNNMQLNVPAHGPLYYTIPETCASVLLKTLDLLGYMSHDYNDESIPVILETSLSKALSRFTCDTLSEYAVLMIELLRTKSLTDNVIQTTIQTENKSPTYPRGVRFACRLVSIIPLNLNGPWSGPFDVEMAAFSSLSRSMSRALRSVIDAIASTTFVTQRTRLSHEQLAEVLTCLPFHIPVEFAAGNLMLYILQNPKCTLADLERTFPECCALQGDLFTLFAFWKMAYVAISGIAEVELSSAMLSDAHAHMCNAAIRLGFSDLVYAQHDT